MRLPFLPNEYPQQVASSPGAGCLERFLTFIENVLPIHSERCYVELGDECFDYLLQGDAAARQMQPRETPADIMLRRVNERRSNVNVRPVNAAPPRMPVERYDLTAIARQDLVSIVHDSLSKLRARLMRFSDDEISL